MTRWKTMEDRLVSLKQVLDTVDEMPVMKDNNGMEFIEKSLAKMRIVLLPSAQPERKRGKWIDDGTELGCCCDSCGITLDEYFTGDLPNITLCKNLKFCPNCGADMQ